MSIIASVLMVGGTLLFKVILIFLLAIPTGMGLGVGLYAVKKFFKRMERKKLPTSEERAREYQDELTRFEKDMVAAGSQA